MKSVMMGVGQAVESGPEGESKARTTQQYILWCQNMNEEDERQATTVIKVEAKVKGVEHL